MKAILIDQASGFLEIFLLVMRHWAKKTSAPAYLLPSVVKGNSPNRMAVAEIESRNYLPEESPCFLRSEAPFFHQIVEQLSSGYVFQNQVPFEERRQKKQHGNIKVKFLF